MGTLLPPYMFIITLFFICSSTLIESRGVEATSLINHLGEYALRSYTKHNKTGFIYKVQVPDDFTGVGADTGRFRCGSLRRYGAQVKEFSISMGVSAQPCVERVLIVRQILGEKWSSIYYENYNVSGYTLVSPILGLVVYDATNLSSSSLTQVELVAGNKPIRINFSNVTKFNSSWVTRPLCASFGSDGQVNMSYPLMSSMVCATMRSGHFGMVIETPTSPTSRFKQGKVSKSKLIIGVLFGVVVGASLLGFLFVALIVKAKKKSQMVEMERRAYEEEALQISMVGHVRAPMAPVARTVPILEHDLVAPQ